MDRRALEKVGGARNPEDVFLKFFISVVSSSRRVSILDKSIAGGAFFSTSITESVRF